MKVSRIFEPGRAHWLTTAFIAGSNALAQGVSSLIAILVARMTTPAMLGELFMITAVFGWGLALADYGYGAHATRELASGRMTARTYWSGTAIRQAAAGIVGVSACGAAVLLVPDVNVTLLWVCLLAAWLQLAQMGVGAALRANRMFTWLALSGSAAALLSIGIFLILIAVGVDPVVSVPLSSVITSVGALTISLVVLLRRLQFAGLAWVNPWSGLHGFGMFSLGVAVSGLDVPAVGAVGGAAAAGEYGIARRLVSPVLIAANAVNVISLQEASRAHSGLEATRRLRGLWPLMAIGLAVSLALALFAPVLVPLILGPQYGHIAPALTVTALAGALSLTNSIVATNFNARGHDRLVALVMWIGVAVQFLLIWLLCPTLGALGAAIAFFSLQAVFFAGMALSFRRLRRAPWRDWRAALLAR